MSVRGRVCVGGDGGAPTRGSGRCGAPVALLSLVVGWLLLGGGSKIEPTVPAAVVHAPVALA